MNVLHVVNISFVIPYYLGSQIEYIKNNNINLFIACTPSSHLFDYAKEKGFNAIGVNILREISIIEDLKAVFRLVRLIKEEKIEVVIGHTPKGALIGMMAAYLSGTKKRIYFRHGLVYETSRGFKRMVLKTVERFTGFLASRVICVSPSVLEISNKESLSNACKNIILNKGTCNGIDAEKTFNKRNVSDLILKELKIKYKLSREDRVIGYVGRLVNDKGINELVSAWKKIIEVHKNVKLLLAGPFEQRDSIDEAIKSFIMEEPSIIHTGLINDVVTHYALMDIFILPSHREGFPTVVLEASAMELPIITTNVTGCKDAIVEGETGRFTSINPDAMVKDIEYYLDNPEQAKIDGKNGRKFVIDNFKQLTIWREIQEELTRS